MLAEIRRYYKKKRKKPKKQKKWSAAKKKKEAVIRAKNWRQKYIDYLKSPEWLSVRLDILSVRGRACESCGSTERLDVHHLTYKNLYKEEPEDLMILCRPCHLIEHS